MFVAAVQLNGQPKVQTNLERITHWVEQAAQQKAQLVVLPENCVIMGQHESDKLALKESLGQGPIQTALSQLAKRLGIWLLAGTLPIESPDTKKVYGTSMLWDAKGHLVAHYHKLHLFDVSLPKAKESYQESSTLYPGQSLAMAKTPFGCLGFSICYDIRFPELYRALAQQGAELFVVPSAFTESTGQAHWEVLLRARAIENQCYLIAANQTGQHANGRKTFGHSMIVDPWGRILAEQPDGEGVIVAPIDLVALHQLRTQFPVLQHQRLNSFISPSPQ